MLQAPRQLIHIHPFSADQDIPEYDMDSEDEEWVNKHAAKGEVPLTNLQFEEMMDRLEKVKVVLRLTLKYEGMLRLRTTNLPIQRNKKTPLHFFFVSSLYWRLTAEYLDTVNFKCSNVLENYFVSKTSWC